MLLHSPWLRIFLKRGKFGAVAKSIRLAQQRRNAIEKRKGKVLTMDINMLRRALWVFLRPLIQLITNLLSPEVGDEWLQELHKFLRKEPCWVVVAEKTKEVKVYLRRLFRDVPVPATDGKETLASSGLFGNRIYGVALPTPIYFPFETFTL